MSSAKGVTSTAYQSHTHPHDRAHNRPQATVLVHYDNTHLLRAPIPEDPFDENVYNLIPLEVASAEKMARYKSKFAGMVKEEYKTGIKQTASMGPAKVAVAPPEKFLKKGQGNTKVAAVKERQPAVATKAKESKPAIKAPLPKEQGLKNEKTKKDFVKLNALDNINSIPKNVKSDSARFTAKKDYGTVPEYLIRRKSEQDKLAKLQEAQEEQAKREAIMASGLIPLPEDERIKILEGLKANWQKVNQDYMKLSLTVDTVPKINRKVALEENLKQLEEDIQRFSHQNILVDFNSYYGRRA